VRLGALQSIGRSQEMAEQVASVTLNQKERHEFALSAKRSCIVSQEQNAGNRAIGVSTEQIQSFCDCVATGLSGVLDIEEARYFVAHGTAPASFQGKINGMQLKCSVSALRKIQLRHEHAGRSPPQRYPNSASISSCEA
jgi:hypothetical protein